MKTVLRDVQFWCPELNRFSSWLQRVLLQVVKVTAFSTPSDDYVVAIVTGFKPQMKKSVYGKFSIWACYVCASSHQKKYRKGIQLTHWGQDKMTAILQTAFEMNENFQIAPPPKKKKKKLLKCVP